MSWDIVVFKLNRKITDVEDVNEEILINYPAQDFKEALAKHFTNVKLNDSYASITGINYELECYLPEDESFSNTIFKLYGEQAVYPLLKFCREENWQAFDTSLGEMLDVDHPERNGYEKFQDYLNHVLQNGGK